MFNNIKNIFVTASAFLQNGKMPPNTPISEEIELCSINHLKSRKFFIVFTSILVLAFFYFSSVGIFFLIPDIPEKITGYVTIFSKTIELLSLIVAVYLGVQTALDFKINSGTSTNYNSSVETSVSRKKITVEKYMSGPKEEDYIIQIPKYNE
jgi:hypothetical protein